MPSVEVSAVFGGCAAAAAGATSPQAKTNAAIRPKAVR